MELVPVLNTLSQIKYDKGIALMALLKEPFPVSDSGFLQYDYPEPIATVADTLKKRDWKALALSFSPDRSSPNGILIPILIQSSRAYLMLIRGQRN